MFVPLKRIKSATILRKRSSNQFLDHRVDYIKHYFDFHQQNAKFSIPIPSSMIGTKM